ncbi:hypothetical protein ACIP5Z_07060 [Rothia terrae]|uniref:hypothetical protein n=1 Tax=Rothia terrae TaxID=396015 RepID=UPI00382270D2
MAYSELQRLTERIERIGAAAQTTGRNLSNFEREFNRQIDEINRVIGGSAQKKDRDVTNAFEDARRELREAVEALNYAAEIARKYGRSI